MKKLIFFLFITSFTIASCCTKKYCITSETPLIIINLDGFNDSKSGYVIVIDDTSGIQLGSFRFRDNQIYIPNDLTTSTIQGNNYYIHSDGGRVDSVKNISYSVISKTIECNSCFLSKDYQHITSFSDLEFDVNGIEIRTSSLTIYK